MELYILIALGSIVFSAFFSGVEIAFLAANKLKIELFGQKGGAGNKIIKQLAKYPSYFIGSTLIGNNIVLVIFGMMMANILNIIVVGLSPEINTEGIFVLVVQTLVTTVFVLIFGDFIPKVVFRINPNGVLNILAIPIAVSFTILSPFVAFTITLSKLLIRVFFGTQVKESKPVFSKIDLEYMLKEDESELEAEHEVNKELFENALYLITVKARECMVPRTEIEAVDIHAPLEELRDKFIDTKLSRILIYDETIDTILGYAHHHDLLKKPKNIKSVMYSLPVIPETMQAMDILNLFTKERKSIACVVDEYGGTAGIVTLEDILEEIFGEIHDEYDHDIFIEKKISDDEFIFSGRLEVDYLNETYNLGLPVGEYETLGGYIIFIHQSIPNMREKIVTEKFEFTTLKASETKIETVRLKVTS